MRGCPLVRCYAGGIVCGRVPALGARLRTRASQTCQPKVQRVVDCDSVRARAILALCCELQTVALGQGCTVVANVGCSQAATSGRGAVAQ